MDERSAKLLAALTIIMLPREVGRLEEEEDEPSRSEVSTPGKTELLLAGKVTRSSRRTQPLDQWQMARDRGNPAGAPRCHFRAVSGVQRSPFSSHPFASPCLLAASHPTG